MFTDAKIIAKKPYILDELNIVSSFPDKDAIAPTIITDEIALVTDIKGVCSESNTQTTITYKY